MHRRIAITGLGVVGPAGLGAAPLAAAVREGRSAVVAITHFDASRYSSRIAGQAPEFDPAQGLRKDQVRYVRKTVKVMALDIQMALAAANQAVLDTGLPIGDANESVLPTIDHTRMGIVFGSSFIPTELEDLVEPARASFVDGRFSLKGWGSHGFPHMFPLWLLKYLPNMHACHTGIVWDCQGPSNSLTTSDAGGLLSLDEAVRILRRGTADLMLAGGAESRMNPVLQLRYSLLDRLSTANDDPAGACRPFDLGRTGQVTGEGAAVVALEALESAQARGARIYGEVLGSGTSTHASGINTCDPDGRGVAGAVRRALKDAGLKPEDLGAVVAHGTALEMHDKSESRGLATALGAAAPAIPVTGIKGVTGNMGPASGLAELAAALLFLKDGQVPPILNCTRPDPEPRLAFVSGGPRPLAKDIFLVTTNAIGGQTAAVIVKLYR